LLKWKSEGIGSVEAEASGRKTEGRKEERRKKEKRKEQLQRRSKAEKKD
jgi:hypothetical protein